MLAMAGKELGGPGMEEGMTWEQVAELLGRDKEELMKEVVGKQEVEPVNGKLKIWTRARHVASFLLLSLSRSLADIFVDSSRRPSASTSSASYWNPPPQAKRLSTPLRSSSKWATS